MKVRVLLMGFGNVGRGFCSLLSEKREMLRNSYGIDAEIVGVCTKSRGNIYDPSGIDLEELADLAEKGRHISLEKGGLRKSSLSAEDIVEHGEYDVLAECTVTSPDGKGPALSYIRSALSRGRSVITTNKGPIAFFYRELVSLAESTGANLLFEGTVMAGTPVFAASLSGLSGTRISGFEGVLNGTCNFILDLLRDGMSYEAALLLAQEKGYAEADPSMDVEGVDTALKAMILSQSLMNADVPDISEIEIKGISDIDPDLFVKARKNSERIRLVARSNIIKGKNSISVSPVSLSRDHPLYNLPGAVNGLVLSTDILGNVSLTGKGAGSRETGFALLKDLISLSAVERRIADPENGLSGRMV